MSEELKPCPFCGCSVHIESVETYDPIADESLLSDEIAVCGNHDTECIFLYDACLDTDYDRLVRDWNRRA